MRGFTLIETIMYIGLFGVLIMGLIVSLRMIMDGTERMNERVMVENEVALVSRSIVSLIAQAASISTPQRGETGNTLTLTTYSIPPAITYSFTSGGGAIMSSVFGSPWTNLTNSRVHFDTMEVRHVGADAGMPGYIEISYVVSGETYGPIRSYLNF